jgi:competence protein ComEA
VVWVVAALLGGIALMRIAGCGADSGSEDGVRIARSSGPGGGSTQGAHGGDAGIYVHVAGAVRRPGLLRLREGARVAVAVDRAGGPLRQADLSGVNLAARLEDGQQVIVPRREATPRVAGSPTVAGVPSPGSAGAPKLSLGAVTVEQLDELDGIGPTLAQRIVEYRTEHGGFRSLGELREVEGIGEKRFASLREALQP